MERVFKLFPAIADRKGQLALTLSGGERQAVAIARGLMAANIKLLMIDEPSAGLAPLIIDDKVIIGSSGAEYGIRGFVRAYNAATGALVWNFYTIPAPDARAEP